MAPHDHGIWETLFVWRGKFHHTVYAREDDGSAAGKASLRVLDDRDLAPGDFAIVAPPDDIHGFRAVAPGSWGITIVDGAYKDGRNYYDPARGTVMVKRQRNAR